MVYSGLCRLLCCSSRKFLKSKAWLVFLFFIVIKAEAQPDQVRFAHISTDEGLSQTTVFSIVQDTTGFMWFGTWDGLNRYDGYSFTVFRSVSSDSSSISNNFIHSLFVDSKGNLWAGTENGLNRFNPLNESFTHFFHEKRTPSSLSCNMVSCFCEDKEGNFWIGTKGGGLNSMDRQKGTFKAFQTPHTNNTVSMRNFINCIIPDAYCSNKSLILGTEEGLCRFNIATHEYRPIHFPEKDIQSAVLCLLDDGNGVIWIGTWGQGLIRWDKKRKTVRQYMPEPGKENSIPSAIISSIETDPGGNMWIGTRNQGLALYQKETDDFLPIINDPGNPNSLSDNAILSSYKSHEGILWFGSQIGGINKYNYQQRHFKHFRYNPNNHNSINSSVVTAIFEDAFDNLWIGTRDGGLNFLDRTRKVYSHYVNKTGKAGSLSCNNITSIWQAPGEAGKILWIGTDGGGLNRMDLASGTFISYQHSSSNMQAISTNYIYSICADRHQRLWIGTMGVPGCGGLDMFVKKTGGFVNFPNILNDTNGINTNVIMKIFCDSQNRLWVGTKGFGLCLLILDSTPGNGVKPRIIRKFVNQPDNPHSLSNNDVFAIYEDAAGVLWIGTGGGLNRYEPDINGFSRFTIENGLPSNTIYGILDDRQGNLWISTSNGLARIGQTGDIRVFDRDDGIQENAFYPGACFKSYKGELFFGGSNGLTAFVPDSLTDIIKVPRVVITGINLYNRRMVRQQTAGTHYQSKPFLKGHEVIMTPRDFMLAVDFAALDYIAPRKITYQYKLEGFNEEWIQTSADNRRATFTNLPPGRHILRIIITGEPNAEAHGAMLIIRVLPAFYQTLLFKILAVLILASLLSWLFIRRIRRLSKEKVLIEQQAEKNLFEERNQLRTLIDNMPDLIYIKDRESQFVVANRKMAKIMGNRNTEDLIGKTDHIFYPPDLANKFYQDEQHLMATGVPLINHVEPGIDERGGHVWISVTKVPLRNSKNEVVGLVGIGRDITQIKQTEEKLIEQTYHLQNANAMLEERQEEIRQQSEELQAQAEHLTSANQELERLNHSKDKLFSLIAHDLKNPFHAISGFSNMLSRNFSNISDNEKLEILDLINLSSETAYNLLENLLQWARTQTDRIKFSPEKVNISNSINENIHILSSSAKKKQILLSSDVSPELFVMADTNMLNTILRNLISNAIKFTPENGNGKVSVSSEHKGNVVEIEVTDNGIGISAPLKNKLFLIEDYQTTPGTSGEAGTGLGLIICKEFVEKHGGKIWVESEPQQGSTFYFTLPVAS